MGLLVAALGCGRIAFDPSLCIEGDRCELPGGCLAGTQVCGATPACVAAEPVSAGTPCAIGTCDGTGVCVGAGGTVLRPTSSVMNTGFGFAVALDGDRLAISAPYASVNAITAAGAVLIWERSGDGWVEVAQLTAPDPGSGDYFGTKIALQGDRLFVAAQARNTPAIYAFERIGGAWMPTDLITVAGSSSLGTALALDGDRAIIGDQYTDLGAAYIVERRPDRTWGVVATLASPTGSQLGHAVDLEGDRAAVGSLWDDNEQGLECGSVRVFERALDGTWPEVAELSPPANTADISFDATGASVALDGEHVLAGSVFASLSSTLLNAGALLAFTRDPTLATWTGSVSWEADPIDGAQFGRSIAMAGDRVIAASPDFITDDGRLVVFRRMTDGSWRQLTTLVTPLISDQSGRGLWNALSADLEVSMSGDRGVVGYYNFESIGAVVIYDLTGL